MARGGARHFHLGGPLEGPVLQQGELSMVCVGFQCSDMTSRGKFWGGHWGGARQNFGGEVASPGTPLAPPLFVHVRFWFSGNGLFVGIYLCNSWDCGFAYKTQMNLPFIFLSCLQQMLVTGQFLSNCGRSFEGNHCGRIKFYFLSLIELSGGKWCSLNLWVIFLIKFWGAQSFFPIRCHCYHVRRYVQRKVWAERFCL